MKVRMHRPFVLSDSIKLNCLENEITRLSSNSVNNLVWGVVDSGPKNFNFFQATKNFDFSRQKFSNDLFLVILQKCPFIQTKFAIYS